MTASIWNPAGTFAPGESSDYISYLEGSIGARLRTLTSKLQESRSVKDFGVTGDGVTDDWLQINVAISAAIVLNCALFWPSGIYRHTDTLNVSAQQWWYSEGATLKLDRAGTFIKPSMVTAPAAAGSKFRGLIFDHNALGIAQPVLGNQIAFAYCSGVLIGSDDTFVENCKVLNSWDNGFGVGLVGITGAGTGPSPYVGSINLGKPERVLVTNSFAKNCGIGVHNAFGELGKKGGGFNNLSGSRVEISSCIVESSANGFISDFGSQAQAVFDNCIVNVAIKDPANPTNGSGIGFYLADGPNIISNSRAYFCERYGFVIDPTSASLTGGNLLAYACGEEGFIVAASNCNLNNVTADSCGTLAANIYNAITFDTTGGAISATALTGVRTRGASHRYAVGCVGTVNILNASVSFAKANGATGLVNASAALNQFLSVQGYNLNRYCFGAADPQFELEITGETGSYLVNPVGDSGGNGTFAVSDLTTRTKRVAIGYDTVNDLTVMQSLNAGISVKPLLLNPSGGEVGVGTGAWNTGPAKLGVYRLWVDGSGRLRIKSGVPASDTDGTVVGTQV